MWGEPSKVCETNCQCSGLITDSFKINSGNNATKRRHEEASANNFKYKMIPHPINFDKPLSPLNPKLSPLHTPRRALRDIQNSPLAKVLKQSPLIDQSFSTLDFEHSPVTTKRRNCSKISKVFEERSKFKMSNKENEFMQDRGESFMSIVCDENTRDSAFNEPNSPLRIRPTSTMHNWAAAKLSVTPDLHTPTKIEESSRDSGYSNSATKTHFLQEDTIDFSELIASTSFMNEPDCGNEADDTLRVPGDSVESDNELETLHDLDEVLESDNFDHCTKYEIISTDSPNIISRGHSSRKIQAKDFVFGAPLAEAETSTSFNKPNASATRMLRFDEVGLNSPRTKLCQHLSSSSFGSPASSPARSAAVCGLYSAASTESGFVSELEEPTLEIEESNSPKMASLASLLSGQIKTDVPRAFQRSASNPGRTARAALFSAIPEAAGAAGDKRGLGSIAAPDRHPKRRKPDERPPRPPLQRALSENAASIMSAMDRSASEPDLIGDFSQPFALPLVPGQHSDLKSISCDTLARLLAGDFKDSVDHFQVIDCRYPYEFAGGHVAGARNLHTPALVAALLGTAPAADARTVLVFHCEFSLQRGPNLCRYLRSADRAAHAAQYPRLAWPELYLLHEGYRAFHRRHPALCRPAAYVPMLHPDHRQALALCRANAAGLPRTLSMDARPARHKPRSRLLW